jgi:acetyltransferase-like isoleucine patch superfamily enzyme
MAVTWLPGPIGQRWRQRYWGRRLGFLGRGVRIEAGVQFIGPRHIFISDDCWIDRFAILMAGPPSRGERRVARREKAGRPVPEGQLRIAERCHIAPHAILNGHGGVTIGRDTTVAAASQLISLSHHYRNIDDDDDDRAYNFGSRVPPGEQALISAPVILEDCTALGANSVMLPGTVIGRGSWVGAGSVVRRDIPPWTIAAGVPAVVIKPRRRPAD